MTLSTKLSRALFRGRNVISSTINYRSYNASHWKNYARTFSNTASVLVPKLEELHNGLAITFDNEDKHN